MSFLYFCRFKTPKFPFSVPPKGGYLPFRPPLVSITLCTWATNLVAPPQVSVGPLAMHAALTVVIGMHEPVYVYDLVPADEV